MGKRSALALVATGRIGNGQYKIKYKTTGKGGSLASFFPAHSLYRAMGHLVLQ
jgi:hypothetical protein